MLAALIFLQHPRPWQNVGWAGAQGCCRAEQHTLEGQQFGRAAGLLISGFPAACAPSPAKDLPLRCRPALRARGKTARQAAACSGHGESSSSQRPGRRHHVGPARLQLNPQVNPQLNAQITPQTNLPTRPAAHLAPAQPGRQPAAGFAAADKGQLAGRQKAPPLPANPTPIKNPPSLLSNIVPPGTISLRRASRQRTAGCSFPLCCCFSPPSGSPFANKCINKGINA